ncbi:putative yapsin [Aspergillus flavus]|uniref:Yapsin n=1 Tax=Aspergillus flavus (strain ATCC 200026 / FGSC A1120 / IAM 13836 / NRRL 3357 / JCM 12722 / SRRC 167) TaxID=332952 RepID=A0A7U2MKF2_ASPFN|nr:putative yapsin [Aspergillus flavus]
MHKTPSVFPIVGQRKVEHLKANVEALSVSLSDEDLAEIDNASSFDIGFPMNFIFRDSYTTNSTAADVSLTRVSAHIDMAELSLRRLCIFALGLFSLVAAQPKVVTFALSRTERHVLEKRKYAGALLGNDILDGKGLYWVNASVETPPQPVQLQLDTGSRDVWMFGPQSCDLNTSPCLGNACKLMTYNPTLSSTSKILDKGGFTIQYVTPGSGVKGDYVGDNSGFGSVTVQGLTMGVARQAQNVITGIMGIGFAAGESIVSQGQKPYKNIIDMLVEQELIDTWAYSLWLNDANFGGIMFGGYDTGKFTGDLIALPIQPDVQAGGITSMTVAWTSLSLTDPKQGTQSLTGESFIAPAILDSGTALTYVPKDCINSSPRLPNWLRFQVPTLALLTVNRCGLIKELKTTVLGAPTAL